MEPTIRSDLAPPMESTPTSTAVPSQAPSHISDKEKEASVAASHTASLHDDSSIEEKQQIETTAKKEIEAVDKLSDEPEYPTGFKLFTIMLAICLAVFLIALDNTIIATAIPRITDQFKALNDVGWYGSAYLLATCAFQLMFGKFYTFFSIKWTFLTAIAIFELGSLVCGVAPNSIALIIGRAIAGVGSAGIFSGGLIVIAYSVPLVKRPIYTGLVGGMYGIASVAGPLMGGAFTDHATWRWCFYINLPIGAVTFGVIALFFKSPKREKEASVGFVERFKQLDPIGNIFFLPGVICLLLALQWGGTTYAWSDGRIIALFVLFGVLGIAFIATQIWQGDKATIPPRIVTQRSVAAGAYFSLCFGGSFFILIYYLPIWFQAIKGVSATQSGIDNLPMILAQVLASVISGVLISKLGYYTPFMYFSVMFMAVGAGLLTTFAVDTPTARWIGYQIIYGFGGGLGFQSGLLAAQTALPLEDVPIGTSFVMFVQILGGALFVAVGQNIFTNNLLKNLIAEVPGIDPAVITRTGATQLATVVRPDQIGAVLHAYNGALDKTYQISLILAVIAIFGAIFMEWKSVKGKKIEAVGGA